MTTKDPYSDLITDLTERGHSPEEISNIMDQVKQYDREVNVDSVMDSIANGSIDVAALLAKLQEQKE